MNSTFQIPDLSKAGTRSNIASKKKRGNDLTTRDLQGLVSGPQHTLSQGEKTLHLNSTSPRQVKKGPNPNLGEDIAPQKKINYDENDIDTGFDDNKGSNEKSHHNQEFIPELVEREFNVVDKQLDHKFTTFAYDVGIKVHLAGSPSRTPYLLNSFYQASMIESIMLKSLSNCCQFVAFPISIEINLSLFVPKNVIKKQMTSFGLISSIFTDFTWSFL